MDKYFTNDNLNLITKLFKITDLNGKTQVMMKYNFDNMRNYSNNRYINISNANDAVETLFNMKIPINLSDGNHILNIFCEDSFEKRSNILSYSIQFRHNKPELSLLQTQKIFRNIVDKFIFKYQILDNDDNEVVKIFMKFDNNAPFSSDLITVKNAAVSYFKCDFPSSIEIGNHTFYAYATDSFGLNSSTQYFNFSYIYNIPSIEIIHLRKFLLVENSESKVMLNGTISKYGILPELTLEWILDRTKKNDFIKTFRLENSEISNYSQMIVIPTSLDFGYHSISVYGCYKGDYCNNSNEVDFAWFPACLKSIKNNKFILGYSRLHVISLLVRK